MRMQWVIAAMFLSSSAFAQDLPPGWQAQQMASGQGNCAAWRQGDKVDTWVIVNKQDRLIVAAARPEWRFEKSGRVKATLAVDGGPEKPVEVSPLVNLVLYGPTDSDVEAEISNAKTLQWHFPWGDFTADVTGIADAVAAVRQCNKKP